MISKHKFLRLRRFSFLVSWAASAWGHLSGGKEGINQNQPLPLELNPPPREQHRVVEKQDLQPEFDPWLCVDPQPLLSLQNGAKDA